MTHIEHLTYLSPCQSEQPGCAATAEFVPVSLAASESRAQPRQLHLTENNNKKKKHNITGHYFFSSSSSCQLRNILEDSGSNEWECCLIRKSCGEGGMFLNDKRCNQYCSEGVVLTDAHQSTRLTNKQSWAWSVATFDLFRCNYSRPGALGEISGQSFLCLCLDLRRCICLDESGALL